MVTTMFLIVLLIVQFWGLYCHVQDWVNPSKPIAILKAKTDKEMNGAANFTVIVMALLYIPTLLLGAKLVPNSIIAIALIILAAIEFVLVPIRVANDGKFYSGTNEEMVAKFLHRRKSLKSVLSFIGNLIETAVIVIALCLIFIGGVLK